MSTIAPTPLRARRPEPKATPWDPDNHRWRRRGIVFLIFVVATGLMLRRTPSELSTRMPGDLGDAVEMIWILRWAGHGLVSNPLHLFNANIFWPLPNTLALSDPMVSVAPVYGLFFALTSNWVLSWNVLWIGLILLNLGSTYSLTRWLTGRTDAAVFAALPVGFSAFVLEQSGHPALQVIGLVPLGLLLLCKVLERPRFTTAALLGLVTFILAIGALYIAAGFALAVVIIVGGVLLITRGRIGWRVLACLALAAFITMLSTPVFVALHQVTVTYGKRGLVPEWGMRPRDIVRTSAGSYLYKALSHDTDPGSYERHLFPGFTTIALALVGLVVLFVDRRALIRRRSSTNREANADPATTADREHLSRNGKLGGRARVGAGVVPPDRSRYLILLIVAGAVIGVLAVGALARGPWTPWRAVYRYGGPLAGIRVPARLAYVSILAGAVLAGSGLAAILRRVSHPALGVAVTAGLCALVLVELAAPIHYTSIPDDTATLAVYHELAQRPSGPVVDLPIYDPYVDGGANWAYGEASRMVWSTIDFHPRVNGYSGYAPDSWHRDVVEIKTLPAPGAFEKLKNLRVRFLVLHMGVQTGIQMYSEADAAAIIKALPPTATVGRYGSNYLIDLGPQ
jgi:hypothetical protein